MGSSKPWPDVMEAITGTREMDASALLEYFEPLIEWLDDKIEEEGLETGWDCSESPTPPPAVTTPAPDAGN